MKKIIFFRQRRISLGLKKKNEGFTRTPKFGVTPKGGGFTLIETLVAVSIFTVSILALLVVLAGGISNTTYAKQKIIASYLAAEGIEYTRNMRDTYVLYSGTAQAGWDGFNTKLTTASCEDGCYFDDQNLDYNNPSQPMTGITVAACGETCPTLLYNSATGKYGYASGTNSNFVRKITITSISANEKKISSTVYWTHGSSTSNLSFSEDLFNWVE